MSYSVPSKMARSPAVFTMKLTGVDTATKQRGVSFNTRDVFELAKEALNESEKEEPGNQNRNLGLGNDKDEMTIPLIKRRFAAIRESWGKMASKTRSVRRRAQVKVSADTKINHNNVEGKWLRLSRSATRLARGQKTSVFRYKAQGLRHLSKMIGDDSTKMYG